MTYIEAKNIKKTLELICKEFAKEVEKFPNDGPMGLTSDEIKIMPEFQAARNNYNTSFAKLRKFNSFFVKTFKKEYREERKLRAITYINS